MSKFNLYEVGGDWNVTKGVLISTHKTKEAVRKRMMIEAKKRVPKVYYYRDNLIADHITIIDYGSYTKFLAIEEVKDELY